MNQQLDALIQKEMTRKQFLAAAGMGVASLMGASTIIKMLSGKKSGSAYRSLSSAGYGSSPYGGLKK